MSAITDAFGESRHIAKRLSFALVMSSSGEDCVALVLHDEATGGPQAFFIRSPAATREAAFWLLGMADEAEGAS
jgi:hypothetical protein